MLFYVEMIMDLECALHEELISMLVDNFWILWIFSGKFWMKIFMIFIMFIAFPGFLRILLGNA
jgi:hypothetical protein